MGEKKNSGREEKQTEEKNQIFPSHFPKSMSQWFPVSLVRYMAACDNSSKVTEPTHVAGVEIIGGDELHIFCPTQLTDETPNFIR